MQVYAWQVKESVKGTFFHGAREALSSSVTTSIVVSEMRRRDTWPRRQGSLHRRVRGKPKGNKLVDVSGG